MAAAPAARQLTRAALPLVPSLGFTSAALIAASGPSSPISPHTLNALFPSPPPAEPSDWSLRGLALGNGARRSRSRHELVALARGEGTAPRDRERTGPARALVDEWLVQGRDGMRRAVRDCGLRGEDAIRFGMRERIAYNEPVLDKLPQVRSLSPSPHSWSSERADPGALARRLSPSSRHHKAPTSRTRSRPSPCPTQPRTSLTSPTSPRTSQKRAAASRKACVSPSPSLLLLLLSSNPPLTRFRPPRSLARAQTDWYTLRLRLSTAYALAELSLLSPSASSSPASTPERIAAAQQYADRLLDQGARVGRGFENAGLFAEWVRKSWAGIGRSVLA